MERQSFMMTETDPGTHGKGPACFTQGREDPFAQLSTVTSETPMPELGCARRMWEI